MLFIEGDRTVSSTYSWGPILDKLSRKRQGYLLVPGQVNKQQSGDFDLNRGICPAVRLKDNNPPGFAAISIDHTIGSYFVTRLFYTDPPSPISYVLFYRIEISTRQFSFFVEDAGLESNPSWGVHL